MHPQEKETPLVNSRHRRCILHIGAPKTGSTALQFFLDENRGVFLREGLLYPQATARRGGHHDLAFLLHGGYPHWATPQDKPLEVLWQELENEVGSHPGDVLLSSENFYLFPAPARFASMLADSAAFRGMHPEILVYLRPQEDMHEAWYNQAVKAQGYAGDIADSIADTSSLWNYASMLKAWRDCFGNSSVHVRLYQGGSGKEWDVRQDLLEFLGMSPEGCVWASRRPNTNLNRDILEFQRILNRLPVADARKRQFHQQFMQLSASMRNSGVFHESPLLSDPQRLEIRSRFEASNAEVARDYLQGRTLFGPVALTGEAHKEWNGLKAEALALILAWILLEK